MQTISIREAAERLGVSVKVVRRLVSQGALRAEKTRGAHGEEWRVDASSVEARRSGGEAAPPRPVPAPRTLPAAHRVSAGPGADEVESLRRDKAFLERQVETLTALLQRALTAPPLAAAPDGTAVSPPSEVAGATSGPAAGMAVSFPAVTQALQSSLRLVDPAGVAAVELCSVKVLWGRPVLWRLLARDPADVQALLDAALSPAAAWDPPGEEVVFLWLTDPDGEILWACACGPGWFGPAFEEALRAARVERA